MYFYTEYIGKLPGLTNEFQRSMVFETDEFERPKFHCISLYEVCTSKDIQARGFVVVQEQLCDSGFNFGQKLR